MLVEIFFLCRLHKAAGARWGEKGALLARLLTISQFHLLFYCSRPLPNTFALLFVVAAFAAWIGAKPLPSDDTSKVPGLGWQLYGSSPQIAVSCFLLTASTVWFRCDMLVLLFPVLLCMLWQRKVGLLPLIAFGAVFGLTTLLLTVGVDSVFWGRWLWPEGEVFFFNAIRGGSVAWGVSPWHWYATSALPRSLLLAMPLCALDVLQHAVSALRGGVIARKQGHLFGMVCSCLVFVALYSYLPHKELRFLLPALPVFNLGAGYALANVLFEHEPGVAVAVSVDGRGAGQGETAPKPSAARQAAAWVVVAGIVATNLAATWTVFLPASSANYPGGIALQQLHALHDTAVLRGTVPPEFGLPTFEHMCQNVSSHNAWNAAPPTGCWHVQGGSIAENDPLLRASRAVDNLPSKLKPPGLPSAEFGAPHFPFQPAARHVGTWCRRLGLAPVRVHVGTRAAMTGVSRFGERGAPWLYSKNESVELQQLPAEQWAQLFEYVIAEPGDARATSEFFDIVLRVPGLDAGKSLAFEVKKILKRPGTTIKDKAALFFGIWEKMQSEQLVVLRSRRLRNGGVASASEVLRAEVAATGGTSAK